MSLLEKIVVGSKIKIKCSEQEFEVLGKATYVTRNEPDSKYIKVLLDRHHVLVIVPDEMAYLGVNKGRIPEFDALDDMLIYQGQQLQQVNHDYQIRLSVEFGSPSKIEGNVEFWDYEDGEMIISIAELEGTKERADVVAKYIALDDIDIY